MLNKVMIIGNLGRDPEVRTTPSGQPVASFSVATNRKWNDREGNKREETEWHNVEVWGRLAEVAGQYLRKGSQLYVEGRLKTDSWEDRTSGEKKYKTKVVGDTFQMLGRRGGYDEESPGDGSPQAPAGGDFDDDDIPF
jgi:single-strand DNA-binding protein